MSTIKEKSNSSHTGSKNLNRDHKTEEKFPFEKIKNNDQEWENCGLLGTGIYGNLNLIKHNSSKKYFALKTVDKSKLNKALSQDEIIEKLQTRLNLIHNNINRTYYAYFDQQDNLNIVMDYSKKSSFSHIMKKIKKFSDEEIFIYFFQLLISVNFLHSKGIIHGNLKPNNIVINEDGLISITDYFWQDIITKEAYQENRTWSSTDFTSPEIFQNWIPSEKSDFWSIGVFVYQLLEGKLPFEHEEISSFQVKEKIKCLKEMNFLQFSDESNPDFIDLIQKLMNPVPSLRPTLNQIYEHPIIFRYGVKLGISVERARREISGKNNKIMIDDEETEIESNDEQIEFIPVQKEEIITKENLIKIELEEPEKNLDNEGKFSWKYWTGVALGASVMVIGLGFALRSMNKK